MVATVTHDEVAVPIHCESIGHVELSIGPFSVSIAHLTTACQSGHMTLWCDLADTMVALVSHDEIAVPIHYDSTGQVKLSNGPFYVFMALLAGACYCGHHVTQNTLLRKEYNSRREFVQPAANHLTMDDCSDFSITGELCTNLYIYIYTPLM